MFYRRISPCLTDGLQSKSFLHSEEPMPHFIPNRVRFSIVSRIFFYQTVCGFEDCKQMWYDEDRITFSITMDKSKNYTMRRAPLGVYHNVHGISIRRDRSSIKFPGTNLRIKQKRCCWRILQITPNK